MGTLVWIIIAVVITVLALWAFFTAQRLNSLHIRTDAALAQLQSMLDRRAAVLAALIPEVAPTANKAESVPLRHDYFDERAQLERVLNNRVHEVVGESEEQNQRLVAHAQLVDAETRVQLAHRFYNEAVSDTRSLRLRPAVRLLRLGGTAPLPEFFEYSITLERR